VKSALVNQGYSFVGGKDVLVPARLRPELHSFLLECDQLPIDKYCAERTRRRRHSRLILFPWEKQILEWPKNGYYQDAIVNQDDGGSLREFEPLTATMLHNQFLRQLIFTDFNQTPFATSDLQQPFDIGLHVIRTSPRRDQPAVSSPNRLHKDTEPFTFIHLLTRENVIGGENIVTDNAKEPLLIATLRNLMDTLVVKDDRVFHHVMPIRVANPQTPGSRTVLLIDFTPMRSEVNKYD
jgi:hypothetical protein